MLAQALTSCCGAIPAPKLTSARLVPLGRHNVETKAKPRSWRIELTFGDNKPCRLKPVKVRRLAVANLAVLLAEARAMGIDGRKTVRAKCSPARRHLSLVPGGSK